MLPFGIKGITVLSICCGDGPEGEYLYKLGAKVTVSDISSEAVKAAKRRCPYLTGVVADAENLPFESKSFDLILVRHGLHHLPNPLKGIREMDRVCKKGFIFIEAQKNFLTKVFIKFKVALEYEESGNYVYRFTRKDIVRIMSELSISNYKVSTSWFYYIGYLSKRFYRLLNNHIFFVIFASFFYLFNFLFGFWGNSMVVVALKD